MDESDQEECPPDISGYKGVFFRKLEKLLPMKEEFFLKTVC